MTKVQGFAYNSNNQMGNLQFILLYLKKRRYLGDIAVILLSINFLVNLAIKFSFRSELFYVIEVTDLLKCKDCKIY